MQSILKNELALLDATIASDSFVEVMPAPGVQLLGADGLRTEMHDGAMRIPLGALHAGQHRAALVRTRITDPSAFEGHSRSLAGGSRRQPAASPPPEPRCAPCRPRRRPCSAKARSS